MSPKITVLIAALMLPAAHALPMNTAKTVHGVKAVCAGIPGANTQTDARFKSYPLRVEFAGKLGQYLAGADVSITRKRRTVLEVRCAGPWLFVKLEPGRYRVTAKRLGKTATSLAWVSAKGQAKAQGRVILRFPKQGGSVSAEYLSSLRQEASASPAEQPRPRAKAAKKHHHRLAAKNRAARVARSR